MSSDQAIRIGTVVDLAGMQSGLPQAASLVEQTTGRIVDQFGRIVKSSEEATRSLSANAEHTRQSVDLSAESIKSLAESLHRTNEKIKEHGGESKGIFEKIFEGLQHPFQNGNWDELAEGVGEMISHPFRTAGTAAKDLITAIGPIGAIGLGAAAGLLELGHVAMELVNEEGLATRQTQNLATTLSLTFEETKKLSEMARIVDVDISSLARSSFKLAEALENPSSKEGEELKKLGVSADQSVPPLLQVLEKLSQITDKTHRMAEAKMLLGRSAFAMAPVIEDYDRLSEAVERLGGKLDEAGTKKILKAEEATRELEIAWDHLKEHVAAALAPMATFATRLMTPAGAQERAIDQQIELAKSALEMTRANQRIGQASAGDVQLAQKKLDALNAQKNTLAATAAKETSDHEIRVTAAKQWEAANSKTLDGLRAGLEKVHKQSVELAGELASTLKPLDTKDRAGKQAEYAEALKKEADLKLQIKAAEKAQSGQTVAERNAIAEHAIEQEKKIALARIDITQEAVKRMGVEHQVNQAQETAGLIAAENVRFQIEKDAADRINALKKQTAAAEHKPAPVGTSIVELEIEHQKKLQLIRDQGAAKEEKLQDERIKKHIEDLNAELKFHENVANHIRELNERRERDGIAASEEESAAEIAHATRVYEQRKQLVEEDFQQHKITTRQKIELIKELEKAEYDAQIKAAGVRYQAEVKKGAESPEGNLKGIAEAQAKLQQLADTYAVTMGKLNAEALKATITGRQIALSYMTDISNAFQRGFGQWLEGHKKFAAAMAQSFRQMADQFIEQLIRMQVQRLIFDAINHESEEKDALIAAKSAAIHAFKSVYKALPFPINVIAAPVAAAGAFAGAMTFATFEQGGLHPRTEMALVHGGESTYTERQTGRIEKALGAGNVTHGDTNIYNAAPGPSDGYRAAREFERWMRDGRLRWA